MLESKEPVNESERLKSLRACAILDTAPEPGYEDAVKLAGAICNTPIALVTLIDDTRQWFKARVGIDIEETPRKVSVCSHAILLDDTLVVEDTRLDERFKDNPYVTGPSGVVFYAGALIRSTSNHALGTLCVLDYEPRQLSNEQISCLEALARHVGALVASRSDNLRLEQYAVELSEARLLLEVQTGALEQANDQLETLASTDGLTGLLNRRTLMERIDRESPRVSRERPLSIILADIDNFKSHNDTFGHLVGDEVLRQVASIFQSETRSGDWVGRYGGEEFCFLLPNTSSVAATSLAERIRGRIAQWDWEDRPVTISIGVSTVEHPDQVMAALKAADCALYESKHRGRNQVRIAA